MSYIDGIILAVPKANKEQFIQHAGIADAAFIEWGATRVLECWEDDVPDGKITDFRRAVQATQDEAVVFSWVEWPDKATADAGWENMQQDEAMMDLMQQAPLDGKRMIFAGFDLALDM